MPTFKKIFSFCASIALMAIAISGTLVFAADGDLNTDFNAGVPIGFNSSIEAFALQDDGKMVAGGWFTTYKGETTNYIVRLTTTGARDASFSIGGGFNTVVRTIAVQDDGKIIVGGDFTTYQGEVANRIIRLNTDGSMDTSFDVGDGFDGRVSSIAFDADGNILIGGAFHQYNGTPAEYFTKLTSTGAIDSSLVMGNGFDNMVRSIVVQDDEKIVVVGDFENYQLESANRIVRLTSTGVRDVSFDIGEGLNSYADGLAIDDQGRIIVGGYFDAYSGTTSNYIVRLTSTGVIDTSFDIGDGFNNFIRFISVDEEEKIVVAGDFTSYQGATANGLIRLNSNGSKDTSFEVVEGLLGNGGAASIYAAERQGDGSLVVVGSFASYQGITTNNIIRLTSTGVRDVSFFVGDGFNSNIKALATQSDNKVIVGGDFTNYKTTIKNKIVRLTSTGNIDTSFEVGSGFDGRVNALAIQDDGKILVGGAFYTYQGDSAYSIIRLNTDGSKDTSFVVGSGFDGQVNTIVMQNDGKFLVGGEFTTYQGEEADRIIRLNSNGSRDTSFVTTGFYAERGEQIYTIAIQDDGKILVGGRFELYNEEPTNHIIRFTSTGVRDTSFDSGEGFDYDVKSIVIDYNGNIIVGGGFGDYQGATAKGIIKLTTTGAIDMSFDSGEGFDYGGEGDLVDVVKIQDNGSIIVGGYFGLYNEEGVNGLVKLSSTGLLLSTFGSGIGEGLVCDLLIHDNALFIGGSFFNYDNVPVANLFSVEMNNGESGDEEEDNPPPSSNGGGSTIAKDACPNGDYSLSFYDNTCGSFPNVEDIPVGNELLKAYNFAFGLGITSAKTFEDANMQGVLVRSHLAKMIVNYAIKVMGLSLDATKSCTFGDVINETKELQDYMKFACQLGIMGINPDGTAKFFFEPNGIVSRAEFGTVLSRLLRGNKNNGGEIYYKKHLDALKTEGIMTKIDTPNQKELRGWVMVMMKRIFDKK